MSDEMSAAGQRMRASFARQGLMKALAAELPSVGAGTVATGIVPKPAISQQHGFIHAGAVASIADSAAER